MSRFGKVDANVLERTSFKRRLGKRQVIYGPGRGRDNAVISLGGKKVLIATVDPMSVVPEIGVELSAWLSVHLIASDYWTSGNKPEYAAFNYNFPVSMSLVDVEAYLDSVNKECNLIGVEVVAGHTGSYPGGGFTVVGGGMMFGTSRAGRYLTPSMAKPGDSILMTKQAGVEAASYLAMSFPEELQAIVGRKVVDRTKRLIHQCSVVKDCQVAATCGLGKDGVTSMHDATEGGVTAGLAEMAYSSGTAFVFEKTKVPISDEVSAVCKAFRLDPLKTLSEGALMLTCGGRSEDKILQALKDHRIPAVRIGRVTRGTGLIEIAHGRKKSIKASDSDPYWNAFAKPPSKGGRTT